MKPLRVLPALALLLLGPTVLGACGDDGGGSDSEATGDDATEELQTVRFVSPGHFGVTVMEDHAVQQGYFEENGVKLEELPPIFNAAQLAQSISQGEADMGILGGTGVLGAKIAGRDLTIVGNVVGAMPLQVILNNEKLAELEADGITPDSPIEDRVEALKGITITGPATGSTQDLVFRYALDRFGLDADADVSIQPLSDQNAITASVRENQVPAMFNLKGLVDLQAEMEGWGTVFIDFSEEIDELAVFPQRVFVVSTSFLEEHPEAVEGALRAYEQARQEALDGLSADAVAAIKKAYAPDMPQAFFDAAFAAAAEPYGILSLLPSEEEFDALIDVYNSSSPEVLADLSYEDLYDTSVAERVVG